MERQTRGGPRPARSITLIELGEEWLDSQHATSLQPDSLAGYAQVIERYIMRPIGMARIEYIDASFVKRWQRDLTKDGASADRRARALKYLKMLLNFAVEEGYAQGNPALVVRAPKKPEKQPVTVLSPRQIELIISHMERDKDKLRSRLMAYAGLGPKETDLPKAHVQQRSIIVRRTKTNRVDTVRVWGFLIEDIERDADPGPRVFAGNWTKTDRDNWRNRIFNPAAVEAGFGHKTYRKTKRRKIPVYHTTITPYTFRHSFASMLLRSGKTTVEVAALMRHSLEMTERVYAHVIQDLHPDEPLILPDAILEARSAVTKIAHGSAV